LWIDESLVQNGDYFGIMDFGGMDVLIRLGTGGQTGHTAVAIWIDGELFICESKGSSLNWPPPYGVIITPYKQWMLQAQRGGYQINWARLSDSYAAKFDAAKAKAWFDTVKGMPYGYHNFVFGWIDTVDENYPPPLDKNNIVALAIILNDLLPKEADRFFNQALNHRLGTNSLDFRGILSACDAANLSIWDAIAMPESDEWVYTDGKSMVCSSFVMAMYKAAGVFGDVDIQATEQTPKDSYQLQLYRTDTDWQPESCTSSDRSSALGYCQIMGDVVLNLYDFASVPLADHVNENCGGYLPLTPSPRPC